MCVMSRLPGTEKPRRAPQGLAGCSGDLGGAPSAWLVSVVLKSWVPRQPGLLRTVPTIILNSLHVLGLLGLKGQGRVGSWDGGKSYVTFSHLSEEGGALSAG